jgi:hypothetical protein
MGNDCFQAVSVFRMLPGVMLEIDGVIDIAYFHDESLFSRISPILMIADMMLTKQSLLSIFLSSPP